MEYLESANIVLAALVRYPRLRERWYRAHMAREQAAIHSHWREWRRHDRRLRRIQCAAIERLRAELAER